MKPSAWMAVGCALLTLVVAAAEASTALRLDTAQLVERSELILIGVGTHSQSIWHHGTLFTLVTLDVDESLKGQAGTSVEVLLPGGADTHREIPVMAMWPGQPTIDVGETVLLFLRPYLDGSGHYYIVGFSQGKYTIHTGSDGLRAVSRNLSQVQLVGPERVGPGGLSLQPLESFKEEIRHLITSLEQGARP